MLAPPSRGAVVLLAPRPPLSNVASLRSFAINYFMFDNNSYINNNTINKSNNVAFESNNVASENENLYSQLESSSNYRNNTFTNPIISYDYKCGHYLGI